MRLKKQMTLAALVISAALSNKAPDIQAKPRQHGVPAGGASLASGSGMSRKPPLCASNHKNAATTAKPAATSQGKKLGPMPA